MKLKALTPLLLGAALVSSFTLPVAAQEKDPLRIALISSKSGPFATMGADVLSGVRFAVEEANAKAVAFYLAQGFAKVGMTANCGSSSSDIPAAIYERPIVWAD